MQYPQMLPMNAVSKYWDHTSINTCINDKSFTEDLGRYLPSMHHCLEATQNFSLGKLVHVIGDNL